MRQEILPVYNFQDHTRCPVVFERHNKSQFEIYDDLPIVIQDTMSLLPRIKNHSSIPNKEQNGKEHAHLN